MSQTELVALLIDGLPLPGCPAFGQFGRVFTSLADHDIPLCLFSLQRAGHTSARELVCTPGSAGEGSLFTESLVPEIHDWYLAQERRFGENTSFLLGGYSAGGHLLYAWSASSLWESHPPRLHASFTLASPHSIWGPVQVQKTDGSPDLSAVIPAIPSQVNQETVARRLSHRLTIFAASDDIMVPPTWSLFDPDLCVQYGVQNVTINQQHHHSIGLSTRVRTEMRRILG